MSYVEATSTSLRKTGQIKLHGPAAFAGMRVFGEHAMAVVPVEFVDQFAVDIDFVIVVHSRQQADFCAFGRDAINCRRDHIAGAEPAVCIHA